MLVVASVSAQPQAESLISNAALERNGSLITVELLLDFSHMKVGTTEAVVATPVISNDSDSIFLPSVGVYGRTRWYQSQRAGKLPLGGGEGISLRFKKDMEPVAYLENIPYQEWMNGASLSLVLKEYGCAACLQEDITEFPDLAAYMDFELQLPPLQFAEAVAAEIKIREITGRAFVDFPVNKIIIYPEYRNNFVELGKIIGTIDSVKNDPDITVRSIHIAGTASPEGPYDNNVYLAKNRTKALKEYVQNLYNFPEGFITTSYEPVDWKGLKEWLESNNIDHRQEILQIVESDIEPYARNSKIKSDFPEQYEWLLRNVYPALRHSDYRIEYSIRQFSDVAEIAEVIKTAPQKLDLNEMYLLANTLEPGSDEYNEVFEIAVRMYPSDETANLNAANSALIRKDYSSAERYLEKAGNNAKANYTRGVLKAMQGQYPEAIKLLEESGAQGNSDALLFLEKVKLLCP